MVGPLDGLSVTRFLKMSKRSGFLHENQQGSPTLLNVLGVLGVINVLNMLNMPMDASLACWAFFCSTFAISIKNSSFFLSLSNDLHDREHP